MALGHEGVGTVEQIGEGVKGLKVGDVVGWGYIHTSCNECDLCMSGHDNYCRKAILYGEGDFDQGAFGSHAIWDAAWLFKVPAKLAPEHAAPLMCAGAAVFGVIENYNIRPNDRVGVVGLGGVGHIAIQFLAKMGVRPVVFSSSEAKREEAFRLGASEFYVTTGDAPLDIGTHLGHLMVTTSTFPDWTPFINVLNSTGVIYPLTVCAAPLILPTMPVVMRGLTIQGSGCASRGVQTKMLDFAAAHGIKPIVERFPMTKEGVEEGMAKLAEGTVRYKAVLVAKA